MSDSTKLLNVIKKLKKAHSLSKHIHLLEAHYGAKAVKAALKKIA
jgi:hypothetical protein